MQKDILALPTMKTAAVSEYDQSHGGVYSAIFGGVTGVDVARYLNQRIRHFHTAAEIKRARDQAGFSDDGAMSDPDLNEKMRSADREFIAINAGAGLFLSSVISGRVLKLRIGDQVFEGSSPRVGLMEIGKTYVTEQYVKGRPFPIPTVVRQSVLLHEARHSDCTGGVTQDLITQLRTSKNAQETDRLVKDKSCAHFHSYCTSGDLEGIPACDDHPWGAYAIDLVFLRAIRSDLGRYDQAIVDAQLLDLTTRFKFDFNEMLDGKMGPPDMSSTGAL